MKTVGLCREHGISTATFYGWKCGRRTGSAAPPTQTARARGCAQTAADTRQRGMSHGLHRGWRGQRAYDAHSEGI